MRVASKAFAKAKAATKRRYATGQLTERDVHAAAKGQRFEQAVAGLALLGHLPVDLVERGLLDESDLVLILSKAAGCSRSTTKALLLMDVAHRKMSPFDIDGALELRAPERRDREARDQVLREAERPAGRRAGCSAPDATSGCRRLSRPRWATLLRANPASGGSRMPIRRNPALKPGGHLPAGLPFSEGMAVGDLVFLSGQLGTFPGRLELNNATREAEFRQIMDNIVATLKANGMTTRNVVKCLVMLQDMRTGPPSTKSTSPISNRPCPRVRRSRHRPRAWGARGGRVYRGAMKSGSRGNVRWRRRLRLHDGARHASSDPDEAGVAGRHRRATLRRAEASQPTAQPVRHRDAPTSR